MGLCGNCFILWWCILSMEYTPNDTQTLKDQEGNPLETILTYIEDSKNKFPQCPALKVDSRGRVTIPEYTREVLGIGAGDYVDLLEIRKCKIPRYR